MDSQNPVLRLRGGGFLGGCFGLRKKKQTIDPLPLIPTRTISVEPQGPRINITSPSPVPSPVAPPPSKKAKKKISNDPSDTSAKVPSSGSVAPGSTAMLGGPVLGGVAVVPGAVATPSPSSDTADGGEEGPAPGPEIAGAEVGAGGHSGHDGVGGHAESGGGLGGTVTGTESGFSGYKGEVGGEGGGGGGEGGGGGG